MKRLMRFLMIAALSAPMLALPVTCLNAQADGSAHMGKGWVGGFSLVPTPGNSKILCGIVPAPLQSFMRICG